MGRGKRKQPKYLGKKLKQIRLDLGWTQEQIAERLGVDSGAISRYERGLRAPSLLELLEYSSLAKTSMEALVSDKHKLPR